jgi:hypothetical protein
MKTIYKMFLVLVVIVVALLSNGSPAAELSQEQNRDIEQRTWPAVSDGLVFVGGEFLQPPYVVSRVKNAIYINGKHVGTPGGWPIVNSVTNKPTKLLPHDPEMPAEITKETTQYDPVFYKFINAKRDYLVSRYGKQQAIKMLPDIYKKLPCITDAYYDTNTVGTIVMTWVTGKTDRCNEFPPQRAPDNVTPEQAAKVFDDICDIYYSGLELNDYFMFGTVTRRGTQDGYGQFLVPIAEALKAAKDEEAFISVMTNKFPMVTGFSEKAFRSFYTHKDKLPQWEPLLKKRCRGRE